MAGVQEFQKFMANDAQLKAFGNCINQVNLFSLDPDRPVSFNQRPNRVALVVVSHNLVLRVPHFKAEISYYNNRMTQKIDVSI